MAKRLTACGAALMFLAAFCVTAGLCDDAEDLKSGSGDLNGALLQQIPVMPQPILDARSRTPVGLGSSYGTSCASSTPVGANCAAEILQLHPTQFDLGMAEVHEKAGALGQMSRGELKDYLKEHWAPLVIGPGGALYLYDRHHLALALLKIGQTRIPAEIEENWQGLSQDEFWNRMKSHNWVWLYDGGKGPLSPSQLPKTVLEMKDDPYRALARDVRKMGGYEKTSVPFAEFRWADFFRSRIPEKTVQGNFQLATEQALSMAHDARAQKLPGYIPLSH